MKNCDAIRDRLSPLMDDRLEPAERNEVEAHLADCPDCGAEFDAQARATDFLAASPPLRLDPALVDRTIARARPPRRAWIAVPAAAALLLAWLLFLTASPMTPEEAREKIAAHAALLEPVARQVSHLPGKNPENDLAVVRAEVESLHLARRTEELKLAVEVLPDEREYVERAEKFVGTLQLSLDAAPKSEVVLALRNSVVDTSLIDAIRVTRTRLGVAPVLVSGNSSFRLSVPVEVQPFVSGRVHFLNGNYGEAARHLWSYTVANPKGDYRDAALYWLAQANAKTGNYEEAAYNYYCVLTNGTTWSTDPLVVDGFRTTCATLGDTTVNGSPIAGYALESLGTTMRGNATVTIEPSAHEKILLARVADATTVDALRRAEPSLSIQALSDNVKLRTDLRKTRAELARTLLDIQTSNVHVESRLQEYIRAIREKP